MKDQSRGNIGGSAKTSNFHLVVETVNSAGKKKKSVVFTFIYI